MKKKCMLSRNLSYNNRHTHQSTCAAWFFNTSSEVDQQNRTILGNPKTGSTFFFKYSFVTGSIIKYF